MKRTLHIAALLIAATQFALVKASPAMAEDTMDISRDAARPAAPGPAETFTGDVMVKPLFSPRDPGTTGSAGQVTFSPCARSAWHTHPAGQTLIVTSGTGWVQQWGGQREQMNPGDVIWTPPGVKHWHGATDTTPVTHIAIQDNVEGRNVDWMEKVSDQQYLA
jgi:quercetin dioxygenase-like cupin family protein